MNTVMQLRQKDDSMIFDSGMEMIWFLEDAYEHKNTNEFFSVISKDFKKDLSEFKSQLEKEFKESQELSLYILLLFKDRDLKMDTCAYGICWSKRVKKLRDNHWQREFGKATIVFKEYYIYQKPNFLVYDICGDNPFC